MLVTVIWCHAVREEKSERRQMNIAVKWKAIFQDSFATELDTV
jgi:hypothetical protein